MRFCGDLRYFIARLNYYFFLLVAHPPLPLQEF
jgi:hypothetical protein